MNFSLTPEQQATRDAIFRLLRADGSLGDAYWLERDRKGGFPVEFFDAIARDGWLGIAMPQSYGGAGLGVTEAALLMQAIAESGAGMAGASAIHLNIYGLNPVVVFGTDGISDAYKSIEAGELTGTVDSFPVLTGEVAMEVALRLVSGQKLPRVVATPQALITKDNIKEYQSDDVRSVLMKAAGK